MRQLSLFEAFAIEPSVCAASTDNNKLEVYDFFTGAGGFSTGAEQAGCRVVYACDACPKALETHRRNHPHVRHQCVRLPDAEAVVQLPTDGRRYHVHCSPPCTKLSSINRINAFEKPSKTLQLAKATDMVEWSLQMMLSSGCTSWSLEQVASSEVIAALERARRTYPGRVAWARLDFALLGVPQHRVRIIAGTPRLVSRLQRLSLRSRQQSVRGAIPNARGNHVRHGKSHKKSWLRPNRKPGQTKYATIKASWSDNCRSIQKPSHTIRGRHAPTWVTIRNGKAIDHRVFLPHEMALLQTFPRDYRLPTRKFDAYLQVGNAIPPLVARLLLEDEVKFGAQDARGQPPVGGAPPRRAAPAAQRVALPNRRPALPCAL